MTLRINARKEEADPAAGQVKRSHVAVEKTWDMTTVYPGLEDWEAAFSQLAGQKDQIGLYQGRLTESADTLYQAIQHRESLMMDLWKLAVYAFHRSDEDTSDPGFLAMKGRLGALMAALMGEDAWFEPEIAQIPQETLDLFMEEKAELEAYRHFFDDIIREKAYQLSPKEEALLARASQIFSAPD